VVNIGVGLRIVPDIRETRYLFLIKNNSPLRQGRTMDYENFVGFVMTIIVALYFIGATTSILLSEFGVFQ
jgi:hypothetical protein